jgi:hypothetical protein
MEQNIVACYGWLQTRVWFAIAFIGLLKLVTTINYNTIADSHTLQFTTARTKSLSLLCLHWALPGNGSSAFMFSRFRLQWLASISQFTATHRSVFSVTLLPRADVTLLLGSRPCKLATISFSHFRLKTLNWQLLAGSKLYSLSMDSTENTVSSSSSLLHGITIPAETLFTQLLHSNRLLFSSIIVCLLCHNLAMDNSFCLTCHNIIFLIHLQ